MTNFSITARTRRRKTICKIV